VSIVSTTKPMYQVTITPRIIVIQLKAYSLK
jgi:hypothetical protein